MRCVYTRAAAPENGSRRVYIRVRSSLRFQHAVLRSKYLQRHSVLHVMQQSSALCACYTTCVSRSKHLRCSDEQAVRASDDHMLVQYAALLLYMHLAAYFALGAPMTE